MTRAWLLVLLALSTCGGPPADPAQAQCEAQADNDADVEDAVIRANSQLQEVRVPGVHDEKVARERAVQRCLAGKGLAPEGGVEPEEHE